jgi:prolyl-tRNA synthetase
LPKKIKFNNHITSIKLKKNIYMKLTQNFAKTRKDFPSDETSKNAQLLIKAGYIHKSMAGVYSYLPLGVKVLNNIESTLRKHINNIGGQEILMSSLSPKENWIKTNRWKEIPEYFCLPSQSGTEYRLNPTHEEVVSPIASNFIKTYKDLPDYKPAFDLNNYFVCVVINCGDLNFKEFEKYVVYDEFVKDGERVNQSVCFHKDTYEDFVSKIQAYLQVMYVVVHNANDLSFFELIGKTKEGQIKNLNYIDHMGDIKELLVFIDEQLKTPQKDYTDEVVRDELKYVYVTKPDFKNHTVFSKFIVGDEVFPLSIYQIQNKFRDEVRAKAGILRGREFKMKDMYDFHQTKQSQDAFFERVTETYIEFYANIGLKAYKVNASGGVFCEKFSREFQVVCDAGEDWIYIDKSIEEAYNQEVAPVVAKKVDYTTEEEKPKEDEYLENVIGVNNLLKKLQIDITRSTKTMLYQDKNGVLVVAVVRSDRKVSEEKLQKLYGKSLEIASDEFVMKKTGADIGYAGVVNLPNDAVVFYDDSLKYMKNFETGTNKTHYHSINVCFGRDLPYPKNFVDIKEAIEGDINPNTGTIYEVHKGSEVGNIFDLGQKWVKAFDIKYADQNNQVQYPFMGCHGIGTSRCMGVIAEIYSDEKGLKWPKSVAPYQIHLVTHLSKDEEINKRILTKANEIYANSDEVLWDDRQGIGMGQKLGDAELIGCPEIWIISENSLKLEGGIEKRIR